MDSNKFSNINDDGALESLITALKSKQAILFVGSGCSISLGFPSWTALLKGLVVLHGGLKVDQHKIKNDIIGYAGEIKEELFKKYGNSHNQYKNYLIREFEPPKKGYLENTEIHEFIVQWPVKSYITTNYDKAIESFLRTENKNIEGICVKNKPMLSKYLSDLKEDKLRQEVLHLHGVYTDAESFILSNDEYESAYQDIIEKEGIIEEGEDFFKIKKDFSVNKPIQKSILWTILSTRQVIFIGFGMEDAYLTRMLSSVCEDLWNFDQKQHFAIMPFNKDKIEDQKKIIPFNKNKREEQKTVFNKEDHQCWWDGDKFKQDYGVQAVFFPGNHDKEHIELVELVRFITSKLGESEKKQILPDQTPTKVIKKSADKIIADVSGRVADTEDPLKWAKSLKKKTEKRVKK